MLNFLRNIWNEEPSHKTETFIVNVVFNHTEMNLNNF